MTHPPGTYDAIVVGGGHHGLVSAAYLAQAGLAPPVGRARRDHGAALADARTVRRSPRRLLERLGR